MNMEFEKQLQGLMTLQDPGARFTEMVLASMRDRADRRSNARSRFVVIGVVAAFCAAAAMLGWQLLRPTVQPIFAEATHQPAKEGIRSSVDNSSLDIVAPAGATVEEPAALPPPPQFTVRLLPLQNEATDAPARAAIDSFHAAFLRELRAVPGLILIEGAATGNKPDMSADYQITVKGSARAPSNMFGVHVDIEHPLSDGKVRTQSGFGTDGDIAPACAGLPPTDPPYCSDPPGLAASYVCRLRTMFFPIDPSLLQRLQGRLADRSLDPRERLTALSELSVLGNPFGAFGDTMFPSALRDPAVVHGAIALAAAATDPLQRAQVWHEMRGIRNPDLVQPLIAAMREDSNGEVRLQALATLTADFADDPRARAMIESASREDSRPLVRGVAQRALAGEAAWKTYVVASLKDTSRPAVERIEALFYHMNLQRTDMGGSVAPEQLYKLGDLLADDVVHAIAEVLPRAASDSPAIKRSASAFVNDLVATGNPAVTEMLRKGLDDGATWFDRSFAVSQLARRSSEPRIRATLEKIAASDPDPQFRESTAAALKVPAPPVPAAPSVTAAAKRVRMGVSVSTVQSGPLVPKELVGKVIITDVGSESIAGNAGVTKEDVLLEINGAEILSFADIARTLENVPRDVDVDVLVYRSGEKVKLKARF
jgi:hypothetical protein